MAQKDFSYFVVTVCWKSRLNRERFGNDIIVTEKA
jgi:hypothetical protein